MTAAQSRFGRVAVEALMTSGPALALSVLLQRGHDDWRQCFDFALSTAQRPDTLYENAAEAWAKISAGLWQDATSPLVLSLLFGPFIGFSLVHL